MIELNEEELKKFAQKKIDQARRELNKWYAFLQALDANEKSQADLFFRTGSDDVIFETKATEIKRPAPSNRIKENPKSLRQQCEKILYDLNTPLTSRDLKNEVEKRFKRKYNFYSFSGSFSQSYRRKSSLIKKYDLENPTVDIKSVYALKNWFDPISGNLKNEYWDKVKERYLI